jgi:hypothetical protein
MVVANLKQIRVRRRVNVGVDAMAAWVLRTVKLAALLETGWGGCLPNANHPTLSAHDRSPCGTMAKADM